MIEAYRQWRFHNTAFFLLSMALFLWLVKETSLVIQVVSLMGNLEYIGAFVAGIFFVSTFTVAPSAVILFHIAEQLNPLLVALSAGAGGVIGDFLIFRFFRDHIFEEIRPIFMKLGGNALSRIISTPYFAWFLPVLGAIIIASPFPDEIGIGLMGISRMKNWQFLALVFVLDTLGVFFVVTLARSL